MKTILTHVLTPAQAAGLRARCAEFGVSPEELIARFIADLTDTAGTGGSDERRRVDEWADRSLTFGARPATPRAIQRLWRFRDAAYRVQRLAEVSATTRTTACCAYVQSHGGAQ